MRILASIEVSPEAGQVLEGREVAKDLQLYLMDFWANFARLETSDINGGFTVDRASVKEI